MARVTISPTVLTATGYNLTDSGDFTTLSIGAGNGVQFTFDPDDWLVLKNDAGGGNATFTIKVPTEAKFSDKGITIDDVAVIVANGKTWLYRLTNIFKQSDGRVYVDCDIAGKVLVLSPS